MIEQISFADFEKVEIRTGTITKAEVFSRARKPAYKVWVDFGGEIGLKQTSAQITVHYQPQDLIGMHVLGALNLGNRNIGGFISEFLLLGAPDENGAIVLITPQHMVPNGTKMC